MKNHDIISALYPLHFTQFLMLNAPIRLSEINNRKLKSKFYNYVPPVAIIIIILIYIIYKHHQLSNMSMDEDPLTKFINTIYFFVVVGYTFASFVASRIQKPSSVKLWQKLHEIDLELKTVGIKLDYSYITTSAFRFLFFGVFNINMYAIFLVVSQDFGDKIQAATSYGLMYFASLNHMATICTFVTFIRIISHIYNTLIEKLMSICEKSDIKGVLLMKKIMRIHHDLYDILKLITQVFSVQVVLSFGITFVLLTFQIYNTICSVYNKSPHLKYALAALVYVGTEAFGKLVLTFSSHRCMFRGVRLKRALGKCLARASTDERISKELNAFGLQLLHEGFEIYAANMFLIDLPIFTSVCGTATTYIILLWQTDPGVDLNYSMKKVFGVF